MFVELPNLPEYLPNNSVGSFTDGSNISVPSVTMDNPNMYAKKRLPIGEPTADILLYADVWFNCGNTFLQILGLTDYYTSSINPSFTFKNKKNTHMFFLDCNIVVETLSKFEAYK